MENVGGGLNPRTRFRAGDRGKPRSHRRRPRYAELRRCGFHRTSVREVAVPTRKSPAQIRAELNRIQQRQRQAVNNYNRAVNDYNRARREVVNKYNAGVRDLNRAIDRYNTAARSHNSQVRANRDRLRREVARLNAAPPETVRVTYRTSVDRFTSSYRLLEQNAEVQGWADTDLFAASSAEAANSVAALNALLADDTEASFDEDSSDLQQTGLGDQLASLDPDLEQRWRGALFALNPRNPDAARHFCTSAREMLSDILSTVAPTDDVLAADPQCERTDQGTVSRRARIKFCLHRSQLAVDGLLDFVEADIENVLALFGEFNSGTHGSAGRFSLDQLRTLKARVESAVLFVMRLTA